MLALPDTQACMMEALMGRRESAALALLRDTGALPAPRQRLQIYRNNLFESLIAALAAVYPVVARLVGTPFFRQAASAHIRAHPSRSGNLHDFGAEWPDFLRAYRDAAQLPYLPDVARLEWAYHRAYHEAELPALTLAQLAAVAAADQGELRLHLQPSARFVTSRYPVLAIWQAHQPQADDNEVAAISLHDGGVSLLVVQRALEIELCPLRCAEGRWLCALAEGARLADATDAALATDPGFDLAGALARHLGRGLFTGIALPTAQRQRPVV